MTKAQLLIDFKNMVGPAGRGSEVDNTGLLYWLNDAYMKAVAELTEVNPDYFTKKVTTSLISGQVEYELPSDFEKMLLVSLTYDTTYVRALPLNNIGQASDIYDTNSVDFTQSQPFYYISGGHFGILPAAETTGDNNLSIWYSYTPAILAEDNDEPDIPHRMQSILKQDMYANYLDQNDEHVAAERMRVRFDSDVKRLAEQFASRQVDQPRSVEVSQGSDFYFVDQGY